MTPVHTKFHVPSKNGLH